MKVWCKIGLFYESALGNGHMELIPGLTAHPSDPRKADPGQRLKLGAFDAQLFEDARLVFAEYLHSLMIGMWNACYNDGFERLKAEYC